MTDGMMREFDALTAKAALFDEMREVLTKVLMVAFLPNDVSGCRMVQDARDTLAKANNISEFPV